MLRKFSVGYNIEKNKRQKKLKESGVFKEMLRKSISIAKQNSYALNEDVAEYMLSLGFTINQIYEAFRIYKFKTIESAVQVMMKDSESGLYLHKFTGSDSNNTCLICGGNSKEHVLYEAILNNEEEVDLLNNDLKSEKLTLTMRSDKNKVGLVNQFAKISIPQHILDDFEDPNICRICFSTKLDNFTKEKFSCPHEFCGECVRKYIFTCINNGKVANIKCIYGGCPRVFTSEEIRRLVDNQTWAKYKKFYTHKLKFSNGEAMVMNCPFPDCEEVIDIDPISESIFVECQNHHKSCSKCKQIGWHNEVQCENYDNSLLRQIQNQNNLYKQCPRCKVIIEKNEGCNQMRCVSCDFEFCWLCLKRYSTDHYALYNFTGCPGMRYSFGPKEKNWWDNKWIKCLWFTLSCFIGFLAVLLIIFFFLTFGCAYEFVKCYLKKPEHENNEDSIHDFEQDTDIDNFKQEENECSFGKVLMCIFLVILGLACQPLYLLFYIMYGIMECYRRFGCWAMVAI